MTDINEVELGTAEWKGYVKRALESIDIQLKSVDTKLDILESCVNGMKIKVAAIGGTVSLIVTIVILLLTKRL